MQKLLFYPIAILLLALTCTEFFPVMLYAYKHIAVYRWMLYGMGAYFILRRFNFFSRNEQWLQTTSHEATHAIVGMMFFHKIHSLQKAVVQPIRHISIRRRKQLSIRRLSYLSL